jgi:hypothetical protein
LIGRIASVPPGEGYAFINVDSVSTLDGASPELATQHDVFVHQDDCAVPLRAGLTVTFDATLDRRRGDGYLRAVGVSEIIEAELVPDDGPALGGLPVFGSSPNGAIARPIEAHPWASKMKAVPEADVAKVVENDPMPNVSRDEHGIIDPDDPRLAQALKMYLEREFPHMTGLGLSYEVVDVDEATFDRKVNEVLAELREMGMEDQAVHVEDEIRKFRGVRTVLGFMRERGLIRRNTVVPTEFLPDLFMACPVWYFAMDETQRSAATRSSSRSQDQDPRPHDKTKAICDVLQGNQRWADVVQMFNRRARPLETYRGDVIPLHILRLIREASQHFDIVAIATPYHDVAGADWEDVAWIRSIDPYVVGIQEGMKHFFILGRFSDSGVFPLLNELVADTVGFLRENKGKLRGFNVAGNPYWYMGPHASGCFNGQLGDHLVSLSDELLAAFEAGKLFDWLRGDWELPEGQLTS